MKTTKPQDQMSQPELMALWFARWHNVFAEKYRTGSVQFRSMGDAGRWSAVGTYDGARYIIPIQGKKITANWVLRRLSQFEVR